MIVPPEGSAEEGKGQDGQKPGGGQQAQGETAFLLGVLRGGPAVPAIRRVIEQALAAQVALGQDHQAHPGTGAIDEEISATERIRVDPFRTGNRKFLRRASDCEDGAKFRGKRNLGKVISIWKGSFHQPGLWNI